MVATQLLRTDPHDRLGSGPLGAESIRSSPFFASIDWGPLDITNMLSEYSLGFAPPAQAEPTSGEWDMVGDL